MIDHDVRELLARRAAALDTRQPDQLTLLHARIRSARRRRTAAAVASGALVVALAAVLGSAALPGGRHAAPDPAGPNRATTQTTDPSDYRRVEGSDELEPGRWALAADGHAEDTPLAEVDVPAGFDGASWFVSSDDVTLGYWVVSEVPRDPCRETGRRDPGPTVDDLVTALDDQRLTRTRRQEPVTVGGHDGTYLEIVAPDIDYSTCQQGQVWYWETPLDGARHHDGPAGAIERVWIVDVDGERVVFNAFTTPGEPAAVQELQRMIASVRFVAPR